MKAGYFAGFFLLTGMGVSLAAPVLELSGDRLMSVGRAIELLGRYGIVLDPPIEPPTADDAAYYLQLQLVREGYPHADVDYQVRDGRLFLQVSRGERYTIRQVDFSGGENLPLDEVRAVFMASLRQATLTPFGTIPYVERAVVEAANRLREFYVNEGFLDASVDVEARPSGDHASLSVGIHAGPRFHLTHIDTFGVPPGIPLPEKTGTVYRPGDEALLRSVLREALRNHGYFEATVRERLQRVGTNGMAISLTAAPGPLASIGSISIHGVQRTNQSAVQRRLGLKSGQRWDAQEVDRAMRRLWSSGAFEDVEFEPVPAEEGKVNLKINLKEAPARQISGVLGYGQWEGAFGEITYSDLNFFGSLNRFELTGLASQKSLGALAVLTDPWLMNRDLEGSVLAYFLRSETPAYRSTVFGGGLALERSFDVRLETGWRAEIGWRRVTDTTVFAGNSSLNSLTDYTMGHVGFSQILDRRNDPFIPMSGLFLSYDTSLASRYLIGDVSFFKAQAQATWYLPFRRITKERPFVPFLALNHRAGAIFPFDGTDQVPIQERFFLGGTNTVRSFQYDGMAPRGSDGSPLGGQVFLQGNAELQFPIVGGFFLAGFVDVGNLTEDFRTLAWDETRVGVGLGSRFYTPLGAINVDYGYNLIRKDGDPIGAWQIGFGFSF